MSARRAVTTDGDGAGEDAGADVFIGGTPFVLRLWLGWVLLVGAAGEMGQNCVRTNRSW